MFYFKQFLLFLVWIYGVTSSSSTSRPLEQNKDDEIISPILKYMHEHNSFYSYKSGTIIQASVQDDKLEVTADIETSCDYPCTEGILRCDAVLHKPLEEANTYSVVELVCAPQEPKVKIKEAQPIVHREIPIESTKNEYDDDLFKYNQSRLCLGCPTNIDTNAKGVDKLVNAALRHVESERNEKHVLIKILRLQQQVVAGIKYILLVEMAPTICSKNVDLLTCPIDPNKESIICEVEYWERPWENSALIVKNNCTSSQELTLDKVFIINTTKKPINREVDPDFLSELESQIIPDNQIVLNNQRIPNNEIPLVEIPQLIRYKRGVSDSSSSSSSSTSSKSSEENKGKKHKMEKNQSRSSKSSSSSSSHDFKNEMHNEISSSSSSSSSCDENKKNVKVEKRESTNEGNTMKIFIGLLQKKLDTENVDIVHSSKAILDQVHYKLKVLAEKDGRFKECVAYITASEDLQDSTINKVFCEGELRNKRQLAGGIYETEIDNPKLKEYLEDVLNYMDSKSTYEHKLKIKKIVSATHQVVSGSLWRVNALISLSNCKKTENIKREECAEHQNQQMLDCNIKIWDQPWIKNGRSTNVTCGDTLYTFRAKRSLETNEHFDEEWRFLNYMDLYNKKYNTYQEFSERLQIFNSNLKRIELFNKYEKGTAKYEVNKFADLTPKEFSEQLGLRRDLKRENEVPLPFAKIPDIDLPTSFDWRDKNAVTEVKDQGSCGSCWAFSTTGNIEGQFAIKYNQLKEFSEQELVDCDKLDDGCNGGLMDNAYRSIEKLGGLESERDYPYDAEDEKCHFNKSKVVVRLSGALNISQNEDDMAKWLTQNGPISIAINANAMQFYAGGVSHPWKTLCNPKDLDHGVLIVGYGVHMYPMFNKTLPYWIIKNSWGPKWGEQGYYRVYRGDGTCGLNQTPSSAIVV